MNSNSKLLRVAVLSAIGALLMTEQLAIGYPNPPSCQTGYSDWQCLSVGSVDNPGGLTETSETICIHGTAVVPSLTNTTFNPGWKMQLYTNSDCSTSTNTYPIESYQATNWWEPPIPDVFTSSGIFFFTNKVQGISGDSNCPAPTAITNAGIFTVTVPDLPPVIVTEPVDQTGLVGSNVTFTVEATDCPEMYQWYFNSKALHNQTNANLTIHNVQFYNAGDYYVVVSNDFGSVTSDNAELTVSATGLLGLWYFDDSSWLGVQGQAPVTATDLQLAPSWSSNAVELAASDAHLCYHVVEDSGHTNINFQSGTVRFWFCPNWNSVNQGGSGLDSNDHPALIESTPDDPNANGFWGVYLSPDGNTLEFDSVDETGANRSDTFIANVSFVSNRWYQIAFTYTSSSSVLYIDGILVTNASGVTAFPNFDKFTIGNNVSTNPIYGRIDFLETYDLPLSADQMISDYQMAIIQDRDGNGLPDMWEWNNFGYVGVDPNADPDGDGFTNLQEYEIGTDPNDPYNSQPPDTLQVFTPLK